MSAANLVLGVAAAGASTKVVVVAGVAGLVSGAMSMAVGEYVSVSSQADTERADLARETEAIHRQTTRSMQWMDAAEMVQCLNRKLGGTRRRHRGNTLLCCTLRTVKNVVLPASTSWTLRKRQGELTHLADWAPSTADAGCECE